MIERVRRVVIGATQDSTSTTTHAEEVVPAPTEDGSMLSWPVWGWDRLPTVPRAEAAGPVQEAPFPAPGGVRVVALRGHGGTEGALEDLGQVLPGFVHDPDRPGMHATATIDIALVIEGRATIEAGDGTRTTLGPGDVYVCHGALHRWHYDEPTHIVFVVVGAEHD
ncbi:MAG: hypothetical protein J7518_18260 [Nocardioidaceae bacterium]|nr:hypothetical protein [Nocardioidaceae bacterium]